MELLLQSDDWSCLPTAFAMVTDCLPRDIYDYLGHDGSEIIWPELDEPYCRRSFSIEEMIDWCITQLAYPVELSPDPSYCPAESSRLYQPYPNHEQRWQNYLALRPAVLLGLGKLTGERHAVAWCHKEQKVFDPNGTKYLITDFQAESGFFIF